MSNIRSIIFGLLIFLSYSDAAINPRDETYEVELTTDKTIEWIYDNEESMLVVTWTFKNSSSATTTTQIMTQLNGAVAQPSSGYNIKHEQNGTVTLQSITPDNIGIYYCIVTYTGISGFAPVTGTATVILKNEEPTSTTTSSTNNTSTAPTVTTSTTTSSTTTSNNTSDNTGIIVGACVGSVALLLGICIFVCHRLRSKTNDTKKKATLK